MPVRASPWGEDFRVSISGVIHLWTGAMEAQNGLEVMMSKAKEGARQVSRIGREDETVIWQIKASLRPEPEFALEVSADRETLKRIREHLRKVGKLELEHRAPWGDEQAEEETIIWQVSVVSPRRLG